MEIPGELFKSLVTSVDDFKSHRQYELEIKYDGKLTRDAFSNIVGYLKTQGYVEQDVAEVLDISFSYNNSPYRLSLKGREHVQEYCVTGKITPNMVSEAISKRFIDSFRPILLQDYALKVNMKEEHDVKDMRLAELLSVIENIPKLFRYKKRFSFSIGALRYDCTVVKSSSNTTSKRFTLAPESFEVEVELISRDGDATKLAKDLLKAGVQIYAVVNNIRHIISKTERNRVLEEYYALWKTPQYRGSITAASEQYARQYFIGPQPVTLEMKNVISEGLEVNTIRDNYTVTEKADGERYLLYVDSVGKGYFINNKLHVMPTMVEGLPKNTLFDGEFITRPTIIYAIFDTYWYSGKNVMKESLIGGRLNLAQQFYEKHKRAFDKTGVLLHVKEFFYGTDIFAESARLHAKASAKQYLYRVDGLIFTPKDLPVGALYEGGAPDPFSAWSILYKWKPPEENTIDMQVREVSKGKVTTIDGKLYKVYNVYVGYKASKWVAISPQAYLNKRLKQDHQYTLALFSPERDVGTFLGEIAADDSVLCKNGDVISNNSIVELRYQKDNAVRWVPLRVRKDKTMPNDWGTAMNVWRSISFPVTEDIITGKQKITQKDVPPEDIYYSRNISRDKFASRNMMNFHSFWVKGHYVFANLPKIGSLFDIACGKGGDLRKWKDLDIKTVFGIDKIRDNIENPNDGIYSRMLKHYDEYAKLNYVFGTYDASQRITGLTGLKGDDLFVMQKLLKHGVFDAVSCQMAIHYFFESETILDNFLYNVDRFLKPGGHFVGTCLDGDLIKTLFKTEGTKTVTGKQGNRILWNISREYTEDIKVNYGEVIKIYMESIGIEMVEYLVSIPILTQKLKQYGIELVKTLSFKRIYDEVAEMKSRDGLFEELSDIEKKYSFLNTVFVFQKKSNAPAPAPAPAPVPAPPPAPVQQNYSIRRAEGDGNCFYRAIYKAAKENELYDALSECIFGSLIEYEEEQFVKALREKMSTMFRLKNDYSAISNLFENLNAASPKSYKLLTQYMPPYYMKKYQKKKPESEDELRIFIADHVAKNKEWAGELEVMLLKTILKGCGNLEIYSFNDKIPDTIVFNPENTLYLINEGDVHYDYLVFNTGPKLKLKLKPPKKKLTLKKLS